MLNRFFRKLHLCIYIFWIFLFFVLFFPVLYYASFEPERHFSLIAKTRRIFTCLSTWFSGICFKVHYLSPVDWSRPYVICANHTSLLDIAAVVMLCRQDICFIGKHTLLQNPVTRIYFKTIDIPINRASKISGYRGFKAASERIAKGKSVAIFPEGGIDDVYPPVLQPFKNGPFRLAIDNHIPVLPIVIHDLWKLLWDEGAKGSKPGIGHITVLPAIETTTYQPNEVDRLQDDVFALFSKHLSV